MKKLLFIFLASLFSLGLMAQNEPTNLKNVTEPEIPLKGQNNDDTIKIKVGKYQVVIFDKGIDKKIIIDSSVTDSVIIDNVDGDNDEDQPKHYKSWSGLDFGVNGFLNSDMTSKMPANYKFLDLNYRRSFSFGLNFLEKDIPIIKEYVKLATGLGLEWDNYFFSNNTRLISDSLQIYGFADSIKFDKTKLRLTYLNLPLLLQFNTNSDPKKAFHLSAGVIISYNIGAKTKMVYTINDRTYKDKVSGEYHINPLRYGLTARVGYGNFKIFANYNLSSLFVKDEGPEVYPFTVGISILSF